MFYSIFICTPVHRAKTTADIQVTLTSFVCWYTLCLFFLWPGDLHIWLLHQCCPDILANLCSTVRHGTRQRDGQREIDRQKDGVQYIMQPCQINHTAISYKTEVTVPMHWLPLTVYPDRHPHEPVELSAQKCSQFKPEHRSPAQANHLMHVTGLYYTLKQNTYSMTYDSEWWERTGAQSHVS